MLAQIVAPMRIMCLYRKSMRNILRAAPSPPMHWKREGQRERKEDIAHINRNGN